MKTSQSNLARAIPVEPLYTRRSTPSRRHRQRPDSRRLHRTLLVVGAVATVLVTYVFGCSALAKDSYRLNHLRQNLRRSQVEHRVLQGQVADLQRIDRVLFLAKQQGMVPRNRLRYVKLLPPPTAPAFQQAAAKP